MYKYQEKDVFFDFEVLQNIITTANLYPVEKRIDIGIITYFPNKRSKIPKLTITDPIIEQLKEYIYDINQFEFDQIGITKNDIHIYATKTYDDVDEVYNVLKHAFEPLTKKNNIGYAFGFNSKDYDNAVLSYLLTHQNESLSTFETRLVSDLIIEESPHLAVKSFSNASNLYYEFNRNLKNIDIRLLNEKMQFTSLKRLAAQMGAKILTSKKLSGAETYLTTVEDILELLAYNVSDIFLTKFVFEQKEYQTKFGLANTLQKDFKDRIALLNERKVLKADVSSAKMSEFLIAPVETIQDRKTITYAYPLAFGFQSKNPIHLFDMDFENLDQLNQYLNYLYNHAQEDYLIKINSNEFKNFTTLSFNNEPFYKLENNTLIPLYDTCEKFEELINTYWDTCYNNQPLNYTPAYSNAITETERQLTYRLQFAKETNKQLSHYIEWTLPKGQDQYVEPGISLKASTQQFQSTQRLIVCDNQIQFDLLNFMRYKHQELSDDLYWYYHVARGKNNNVTVGPVQSNDIKKDREFLSTQPYITQKITKSVLQFMPNDVPVFNTMAEGGAHGSEFNIHAYKEKENAVNTFNQLLKEATIEILNDWENLTQFQKREFESNIYNQIQNRPRLSDKSKKAWIEAFQIASVETKAIAYYLLKHERDEDKIEKLKTITSGSNNYTRKFKKLKTVGTIDKYQRTSDIVNAVHTDITSYYPTLIILLKIFNQPENTDEETILEVMKRERIQMKNSLPHDPSTWTEEDHNTNNGQNARKLMLNAPSGKMDEKTEGYVNSTIRLNNKAYRMRVTGQLILLDLAFEISKTPSLYPNPKLSTPFGIPCSINTDGIFAYNITLSQLDQIVKRWTKLYQLDAEAEKLSRFISKDSNNRIEVAKDKLSRASGGSVRYATGANLQGNADKPFIVDKYLTEYLMLSSLNDQPFEPLEAEFQQQYIEEKLAQTIANCLKYIHPETGELIIPKDHPRYNDFKNSISNFILNLQQIFISNTRKERVYVYTGFEHPKDYRYPSAVNRVFYVKESILQDEKFKPQAVKGHFITLDERRKENEPFAIELLKETTIDMNTLNPKKKIGFMSIKNLNQDQLYYLNNQDVKTINPLFLKHIDITAYANYIKKVWENWSLNSITVKQGGEFGE